VRKNILRVIYIYTQDAILVFLTRKTDRPIYVLYSKTVNVFNIDLSFVWSNRLIYRPYGIFQKKKIIVLDYCAFFFHSICCSLNSDKVLFWSLYDVTCWNFYKENSFDVTILNWHEENDQYQDLFHLENWNRLTIE